MKPGTEYEILTKDIFKEILSQDSVENLRVEHDIIIPGKTTSHQIDVFWEFKIAGVTYQTIVQAKHWNSRVDQGELLKFKSVLDDIPGQPRGIFVTQKGYQSGSVDYANAHGILLYELREPSRHEIGTRVKSVEIQINGFFPMTKVIGVLTDSHWFKKEIEQRNISPEELDKIQIDGDTDEISLLDSNLNTYSNLYDLINSGLETGFYELPPTEKEVFVDRDTFIKTNSDRLPFLKIRGTRAEYSVSRSSEVHKFERDDFPEYVLKNLHDDTSHLFSKQRKIIE
ncbi:restriction endonuclease [Leptonema illini]|uniref:Restriction endonuclease n=1 Tax=Leptonema illini DSM 21528 TaxID=929563 RepID=H2CBB1_9LEPT|nr:restriction endonuclease [Leptonema illini]EHQ06282.1 restriction endonuclease [Leptonema illini DSM 21528]